MIDQEYTEVTSQYGGGLLSSGAYGCVYYPEITCKGNTRKSKGDYVTKLQKKDESAQNEIEIGALVRKIPRYQSYFVPILSSCPISLHEIKDDELAKCDAIKKDNKNMVLMKMRYVDHETFFKYMTSLKDKPRLMNVLLSSYNHLLSALQSLQENDIIHYDLKGNNILYEREKNSPLIIDFGMSIDVTKLREDTYDFYFFKYAPDYYVWCPEIHLINYIIEMKPSIVTKTIVDTVIREIFEHHRPFNRVFSREFLAEYKESLRDIWNLYVGRKSSIVLHALITTWKSWDNYSLSMLYLRILYYIFPDGFEKNEFISRFSLVLLQNLHPDPSKRYSIEETIKYYNDNLIVGTTRTFEHVLDSLVQHREKFNAKIKEDEEKIEVISAKIETSRNA